MRKDLLDRVRSLATMPGVVEKLCENLLVDVHGQHSIEPHVWRPPTDVFECDSVYVIRVAVSGLQRDADGELLGVEVLVKNDTVVVRGNRPDGCTHTKRAFFQMEIHYGRFERYIRFTAPFDRDNIRAEYRDGFLEVVVPKAPQIRGKPRRIQVR